jgi:ATP-dependent Clp protease ATP-binding subunit ClpA
LKRAIQKYLETPIGRRLLSGEIRDGDKVVVGWQNEKFTFSAKGAERAETVGSAG